jgi:50S ribosomal protein L16 3-hydroxylase
MDIQSPLQLLGGISPEKFMRTYWHKKPLLIRQAIPGFKPLLNRAQLLALAGEEGVEARLIEQLGEGQWKLSHGPFRAASCRRWPSPAGRRWCKAWTCTTKRRTSCCSSSALCPTRAWTI